MATWQQIASILWLIVLMIGVAIVQESSRQLFVNVMLIIFAIIILSEIYVQRKSIFKKSLELPTEPLK